MSQRPCSQSSKQTSAARTDDQSQLVQTEIARCAILGAQVLRMLCSFRYNSFSVVDSMIRDLERWYAELPESIKLPLPDPDSNKNHDDPSEQFDLDTRATINFLHLIYRGNIILLCRRFLTHEPSAGSAYSEQFRELRRRYSKQAISAALEASRIMKDIRKQEGIYDRCWLIL